MKIVTAASRRRVRKALTECLLAASLAKRSELAAAWKQYVDGVGRIDTLALEDSILTMIRDLK